MAAKTQRLLPSNALTGKRLALSVSTSADLARLGLLEQHLRLALGEVARSVIVAGGWLAYGGHLEPEGYTSFVANELHRYARRDDPLKLFLSWTVHKKLSDEEIKRKRGELALYAEIILLDPDGNSLDLASRALMSNPPTDDAFTAKCLTSLRRRIAEFTDAQFLIGGKREGTSGLYPGVVEEALFALEYGKPLYLAAGFGGATRDIAQALQLNGTDCLMHDNTDLSDGLSEGLNNIRSFCAGSKSAIPENGLTAKEQQLLLTSYRPSEIATLIGLGLGRLSKM